MPSVGMRRTRVFGLVKGVDGARVLRSGRRLWPESAGEVKLKKSKDVSDWYPVIDSRGNRGGSGQIRLHGKWTPVRNVKPKRVVVVNIREEEEEEEEDACVVKVPEPVKVLARIDGDGDRDGESGNVDRMFGKVYTRKRKRGLPKNGDTFDEMEGDNVMSGDRMFGLRFIPRQRSRKTDRNILCSTVKAIPVPRVSEFPGYVDSSRASFQRPDTYISVNDDDICRGLAKTTANYHMDSDDEEWLSKFNDELIATEKHHECISVVNFELMVDAFEKGSLCNPDGFSDEKAPADLCLHLGSRPIVESLFTYWMKKRRLRKSSLISVFQSIQPGMESTTPTQDLSPRTITRRLLLVEDSLRGLQDTLRGLQELIITMAARLERIELRMGQAPPLTQNERLMEQPLQVQPLRQWGGRSNHQDSDSSSEEEEFWLEQHQYNNPEHQAHQGKRKPSVVPKPIMRRRSLKRQ